MKISIDDINLSKEIELPYSKSISNRLLILNHLSGDRIKIEGLSKAKDTELLQNHLENIDKQEIFNCELAGTTFRFLTALFSIKKGTRILTGNDRMLKRPIKPLIEALDELEANIECLNNEFPPLKITGKDLSKNETEIDGGVSSQFISALVLISPFLPNGLIINIKNEIVSKPYVMLTLSILKKAEIPFDFNKKRIVILPIEEIDNQIIVVEKDWSSAAYWYQIVAFSSIGFNLILKDIKLKSIQGDSVISKLFDKLGVKTTEIETGLKLEKVMVKYPEYKEINCVDFPDLVQSLAVTYTALGIKLKLKGLQTLVGKETNRIKALKTELEKLNAKVFAIDNSLEIHPNNLPTTFNLNTYKDHRMAMSFAPLVYKNVQLEVDNPSVVEKSYPNFWEQFGLKSNYSNNK